ncbi:hypothetical protein SAMN04489712_13311 [Thermomonospora echinospora]|uniref:DUF3309 domain-containing protein n=1 Tax=Thermomonospora echinospora TaxID=1992 RepID=A0A1H6E5R9_9ACTN|nr:hypothetical protein [Thermomonospora echinospora]SEG92306.1 hypothetical protein SAMN04489712_13311 [Thermomonospora echinospora]
MTGMILLIFLALMCAYILRYIAGRLRWSVPAYGGIIIVFMIVVLAVWGQSLD